MTGHDPELCSLGWCGEVADHDGPHRMNLLDTMAMDVHTGRPVITQLWLQGESARVRALVLVAAQCEVGLTWQQARRLGNAVGKAVMKYGT